MADMRYFKNRTFVCPHEGCEARNDVKTKTCKSCDRPIVYDAKAKALQLEDQLSGASFVSCRGGCGMPVAGDGAFQSPDSPGGFRPSIYFCNNCKVTCPFCHSKLVTDEGSGARLVCGDCFVACEEVVSKLSASKTIGHLAERIVCSAPYNQLYDRTEVRDFIANQDGVFDSKLDEEGRLDAVLRLSPSRGRAIVYVRNRVFSNFGNRESGSEKLFRGIPTSYLGKVERSPKYLQRLEKRVLDAVNSGEVDAGGLLAVKQELARLFKENEAFALAGGEEEEVSKRHLVLTCVKVVALQQVVRRFKNSRKFTLGRCYGAFAHLEDPAKFVADLHETVCAYQKEGGFLSPSERVNLNGYAPLSPGKTDPVRSNKNYRAGKERELKAREAREAAERQRREKKPRLTGAWRTRGAD